MDRIKVLVTGGGAPGFMGTFKSLVHNYDKREIEIVATDCKEVKVPCKFYQIPKATDPNYLNTLRVISKIEKIDVILPQNTMELETLAKSDLNVCVSKRVSEVNDKYSLMKVCQNLIPTAEFKLVSTKRELKDAVKLFGKCVVKPPRANGSRGMRIIEDKDYKKSFYEEKLSPSISLNHLLDILGDEFPPLIAMEFLEGDEYTVDCFRGNRFVAVPRLREEIRGGISWKTKTVKDENLIEYSRKLSEKMDLKYAFGFQFKGGKILECNPRVQGTMVASTFAGANIIYSAVKYFIGEEVPEFEIEWGAKTIRQYGVKPI